MAHLGLDIVGAAETITSEKFGDWYRDPWGWPEADPGFAEELFPEDVGIVADGRQHRMGATPDFHLLSVPKSYLGSRPAVVQDPRTRLAYTAAAMSLAGRLHDSLPDWVYGWRVRQGHLRATGSDEWSAYKASQERIPHADKAAQTDVTSFFASIDTDRLLLRIIEAVGESTATDVIRRVFEAHQLLPGRGGLPQRSTASALLAQTALRDIDDLIESRLQDGRIVAARRWMDDISFEGPEQEIYELLLKVQEHGRLSGLEMNTSKTFISTGVASADLLRIEAQGLIKLPMEAVLMENDYGEYEATFIDSTAIQEAEDEVLVDPQSAPRSKVGMVIKSLQHYEYFDRIEDWKVAAVRLPHAADKVGRYIGSARRELGAGLELSKWLVGLEGSGWNHPGWVRAQFALAVPSEDLDQQVSSLFEGWLGHSNDLQSVAVAAQRLVEVGPSRFRVLAAERLGSIHDPLLVRILALAQFQAGGSVSDLRSALSRHANNCLTLKYLESSNWKLPKTSADFDPR